jgi:hypothetical protein
VSRLIREIELDLKDARQAERRALAVEDTIRERNALPEFLSAARRHHLAVRRRIAALQDELLKAQQAAATRRAIDAIKREVQP